MKALAWYTVIVSVLIIIAFILLLTGVIAEPTGSTFESILWIVATVPIIILGILVIRRDT